MSNDAVLQSNASSRSGRTQVERQGCESSEWKDELKSSQQMLVRRSPGNEYAELKHKIMDKGLLDKQPLYYAARVLLTLCLLTSSLAFLLLIDNPALQLLNAINFRARGLTTLGVSARDTPLVSGNCPYSLLLTTSRIMNKHLHKRIGNWFHGRTSLRE
jgi:hypothetical protein